MVDNGSGGVLVVSAERDNASAGLIAAVDAVPSAEVSPSCASVAAIAEPS